MPSMVCQCAFSTLPTQAPTWTTISQYVRTISTSRGRQFELDRMQAGTASILLSNQLRQFDPFNASSPYSPHIVPKKRIRLQATWASVTYPIFDGYVEVWPQAWGLSGKLAESNVTASDAFAVFGQAMLNANFPAELSSVRIGRVLDAINWGSGPTGIVGDPVLGLIGTTAILGPTGGRAIGTGSVNLQASTLVNTTALEHLLMVEDSEAGRLFMSRDGLVTFIGRASLPSSIFATFGDAAGELPYFDLTLGVNPIWNDFRLTRTGGVEQVAGDSVSQSQYFLSSKPGSSFLQANDSDLNALANYLLALYKDPHERVTAMTIMPSRDPANLWPQVLGREIGDHIVIHRRPPGGGLVIAQESVIEGIQHTGANSQWTTVFSLSPAPPSSLIYLIVGTSLVGTGIVGF